MKCISCLQDSKYKERKAAGRKCHRCGAPFCFEPREGDPVSDAAFQTSIEIVSSKGAVRWGVEHLYYEVCRRRNKNRSHIVFFLIFLTLVPTLAGTIVVAAGLIDHPQALVAGLALLILIAASLIVAARKASRQAPITPEKFKSLWLRWEKLRGATPEGIIRRRPQVAKPPQAEPDLADYSFDRAVICDRARTVDLLLANNFHFENNCAILSIEGYPPGPFETVRKMILRNPKLEVFALHDATPAGCAMARRLVEDPQWFQGRGRVIDVGLRPAHARPFVGLWQPAAPRQEAFLSRLAPADAKWLATYALELAAIRPEQVLKRLFRAINRASIKPAQDAGDSAGGESGVSFDCDASDSDGGADSFG